MTSNVFMQPQMTGPEWWFYYETTYVGTTWVPADMFTKEEIAKELGGGLVGSIGLTSGFGVRRSAPGYLDCTDWEVFEHEGDAEAAFYEMVDEDRENEFLSDSEDG